MAWSECRVLHNNRKHQIYQFPKEQKNPTALDKLEAGESRPLFCNFYLTLSHNCFKSLKIFQKTIFSREQNAFCLKKSKYGVRLAGLSEERAIKRRIECKSNALGVFCA